MAATDVALFLAACVPAAVIALLLFWQVERLPLAHRLGLGLIGSALLLSHPAFPIAFRVLLFSGLGVFLWGVYGPAIWRRVAGELDEVLAGAHWGPPPPGPSRPDPPLAARRPGTSNRGTCP